jgi:hypothetical protein
MMDLSWNIPSQVKKKSLLDINSLFILLVPLNWCGDFKRLLEKSAISFELRNKLSLRIK